MTTAALPQSLNEAIEKWREEIQGYYADIQTFPQIPIQEVLQNISSWHGRAYFIRQRVVRSNNSAAKSFLSQEVDKFILAMDTQFKIWSRVQSTRKEEWEMARGQ